LFGLATRARAKAMGRSRQEDLILGEYAALIRKPNGGS
jgi:hypothetical protein